MAEIGFEHVERQLGNWADWHKADRSLNLGYPKRAMVASGGGQSVEGVFEDHCNKADRYAAEIMETLVHDLALSTKKRKISYERHNLLYDGIAPRKG